MVLRGRKEKGDEGIQEEKIEPLLPRQCNKTNHSVLSETWRKVSLSVYKFGKHCDGLQPGWYVFAASIGRQMLQTCPPKCHCGTHVLGWLNGSHPTVVGQTSRNTVCFHYYSFCEWQVPVDITNCGGFYVYHLFSKMPNCNLAYCSNA